MARILIVDDSKFSRKIIRDNLEGQGHEIVGEAGDGEEALDLYQSLKPELVTMDVTMPGMDGIECLQKIKEMNPSAKVLMISAAATQGIIDKAEALNCVGFIVKPFDWQDVFEKIDEVT